MLNQLFVAMLAAFAVGTLVARYRLVRDTTLNAPWIWLAASLTFITAIELLLTAGLVDSLNASVWRFLSASSTLCPGTALLGAKRPQNRAWQWIVASMWLVVSLPALQQIAMQRTGAIELHPARVWFMLGLVVCCTVNSLFTRRWHAVVLAGCGQILLLAPYFASSIGVSKTQPLGIVVLSAGVIAGHLYRDRRTSLDPLDRMWLDFRDMFGLVWSLRMMESVNDVARSNDWDLTLCWSGFRDRSGNARWQLRADQMRVLTQTLKNLLRRFVSNEWIDERLGLVDTSLASQ